VEAAVSATRWTHAPAESAAHADREARAQADAARLREGGPHSGEVMAAHQGAPSIAVQDRTHGAGIPAGDRGSSPAAC
jgi:hypothetical protein